MRFSFFTKFFLFSGLLFFCHTSTVQALTLTPTRQTAIIDPGSAQRVKITLTNDEKETVVATGEVDGFNIDEKTNRAIFGITDEATQWIKISPAQVKLAPGETKEIAFTISIPKVVASQVHYLGLFASVAPEKAQVGIGSRVGSLLFLYTAGNLTEQSHIVDFSSGNDWYRNSPAHLFVQLQNTGNIHVLPEGQMVVKNWRDQEVGTLPLNPEHRFLFPNSMVSKNYQVPLRFRDMGKVTARLEYVYGVNKHFEVKEIDFWYVPVWLMGGLAVVVLLLVSLFVSVPVRFFTRKK